MNAAAFFFPFRVTLLCSWFQGLLFSEVEILDLGKIPRAQRRKANIAQQHREIISYCESWMKTFRMKVVHLERLGVGPKHGLLRNYGLTSSLACFPLVPSLSPRILPGAVGQELPPRGCAPRASQRNVRLARCLPPQLILRCDSKAAMGVRQRHPDSGMRHSCVFACIRKNAFGA